MTTQELKQYIDKVLGNSIRCLLPSYWWKRLFNQVADRIEDVEQSTSQLIDSKVEEVKMPIVDSEDELSKLDLPKGSVAAVEKVGEPVVVNLEDCYLSADAATDWDKYTVIRRFSEKGTPSNAVGQIHLFSDKSMENGLTIACDEEKYFYYKIANGRRYYSSLEEVNEYLASGKYRLVFGYYIENISAYITLYSQIPQPSLYIKGDSWERLAKESDVGSGDDNVVIIYANEESARNTNAFNTIIDCYENEKPYVAVVKIDEMLYSANITIQKVNDRYGIMAQCINTASNKFYGVLLGLSVETGVGLANLLTESELITIDSELSDTSENAVQNKAVKAYVDEKAEIREFYTGDSLTDEQKAWNLETTQAILDKKAIVICNGSILGDAITTNNDGSKEFINSAPTSQGVLYAGVKVEEDGTASIFFRQLYLDDKLSDKSINAVQNKVITAALNNKVDKVEGKQLSTEDFTTALKAKLEGLSNYDDTTLSNAISGLETRLNTLVSGDASTAIESFNEIMAFLDGIKDTQDLASIIASIEQQIATKQDKITDLAAIREGASKGMTALQSYKEGGLEYIAVDGLMDKDGAYWFLPGVNDEDPAHTFAMLSDLQNAGGVSQEDFDTLYNGVVEAEEVTATALINLDERLNALSENVAGETVTKTDFETAISDLSNTVLENEEITATALTDLNSQIKEIITRLNNAGL